MKENPEFQLMDAIQLQAEILCSKCDREQVTRYLFEFVEWVALQNLKLYQEGWCEPGGSNGQHLSTAQVFSLYWSYKNKKG